MATAPVIVNQFRPSRVQDLVPGQQIVEGGSTSAPVYLGTVDLASNSNEIAAHHGHPLVQQCWYSSLVGATLTADTAMKFATYCIQVPAVRAHNTTLTSLRVRVRASSTTGTWRIYATTATETGAEVAAGGAGPTERTVSCFVDAATGVTPSSADGSSDTLQIIDLYVKNTTTDNWYPYEVMITPSWADSTDYATTDLAYTTGYLQAQDTIAWDVNAPLNVRSVRELVAANNYMFLHSFRHVVNVMMPFSSSIGTMDTGLALKTAEVADGEWHQLAQYIYFPRAGVKRVQISAAARVDNLTITPTHDGAIRIGWGPGAYVEATVTTDTTNWTAGNWVLWKASLDVPPGTGPLYLKVAGKIKTGKSLYIQAISVVEVMERASDLIGA